MSQRNLLLLTVVATVSYACYVRAAQNPYARYVETGFSIIDRWSLQEPPDRELFEGAMRGMVDVLQRHGDEHSMFVDQRQLDPFQEDLSQEIGGIGVRIRILGEPPLPTILGPPQPGTPAFRADIRTGDKIVMIDGEPTADLEMIDVLQRMRGKPGEKISLAVVHPGEVVPVELELKREIITIESILGDTRGEDGTWQYRLHADPRIGYVRVTKFGDKTVAELTQVLAELSDAGVEAFVLDVRDNYGGALDAAVDISDLFLRAGRVIVTTRGRDNVTRERYVSTDYGPYTEVPLVVLINHQSASASEIVAACLQDYGRAAIVGQRTYGKGTVQRLMKIESGRSLIKLTSATYWRPNGRNIHRMPGDDVGDQWGVSPDAGLEVILDEAKYLNWRIYRSRRDLAGEQLDDDLAGQLDEQDGKLPSDFRDRALDRAVEYLQKKLPENAAS